MSEGKRGPAKGEGGRPRMEIDYDQFVKLCEIMCTREEIAGVFGVSPDTLDRRIQEQYGETFANVYKTYSAKGKSSLRRFQYLAAEKGNASMLIWLGRNWLGQTDGNENQGGLDRSPINININGAVSEKDLDPSQNDNLEISHGKPSES